MGWFLLGFVLGTFAGFWLTALGAVAKSADKQADEHYRELTGEEPEGEGDGD